MNSHQKLSNKKFLNKLNTQHRSLIIRIKHRANKKSISVEKTHFKRIW